MRSCQYHTDQDEEACQALADEHVEAFTQAGYLDDQRYTQAMVASYRRKGESRSKIKQRLVSKGILPGMITAELQYYDEEVAGNTGADNDMADDTAELCAALRFVQRKRLGPFANDPEKPVEQRHYARLARAGFSYHIAKRALHTGREEALERIQAFD
jgi:SOS response regulatory protein OraA/RecX